MDLSLRVYEAIANDNIEIVSELMKYNDLTDFILEGKASFADPQLKDRPSALSIAAFHSSIEIFRYLLINGAEVAVRDSHVRLEIRVSF
jgi:ankyrin repeat protein